LRLKTFGLAFSGLVKRNVTIAPLTYVPAFNFARSRGVTTTKKQKEMEKEFKEQSKMMQEYDENESDGEEEDLNEEDLLEERRLMEEMDSVEFDAQLDKMILDKLNQGKSDEQIIREFFGKQTARSKKAVKEEEEQEEIDYNPEKLSIFEARNSETGGSLFSKSDMTPEQLKSEKKFFAEVRLMEELNKIVGSTEKEPLERLGRSDYMKLGNKLSKQEKDEMMFEQAMMQSQIMVSKKPPPPGAKPSLIVKERGVYEEYDFAKEREELAKKTRLEEYGILAEDNLAEVPENIKEDEDTELAPALIYETPEEKRIRLKTETAITHSKKATDVSFREGTKGDLVESAKDMDIYVPEAKAGDSRLPTYREPNKLPVTKTLHRDAVKFAEKFELDLGFSKDLMKENLFKLKKLEEENIERAENHKQRLKRKKVSKLLEELEKAEVSKTFDFDDNINVEEITRLNKMSRKGILDIEDIKSLKDDVILGVENTQDSMNIKGGASYEVHRLQTQKNVENYVNTLFNSSKQRIMVGVQKKVPIIITEVILNPAITVVNVFWSALDHEMQALDKKEKIVAVIQKNLDQFAKYARGKMCRDLHFKYAMEMRFYYSEVSEVFDDVVENLEQTTPEIVEQRIQEEIESGKINSDLDYETRKDIIEDEVETMAMTFMQNFNHTKTLKSKKQDLYTEEGKKIRNNRNEDGSRKKYKRENAGKAFWDSLDA